MAQCYLHPESHSLVAVTTKCGIKSFQKALGEFSVVWPLPKQIPEYHSVVISTRCPVARLLSAWRQFYVNPSFIQHRYSVSKKQMQLNSCQLVGRLRKQYRKSIVPYRNYYWDPQTQFDLFCTSEIAAVLVRQDSHFIPQSLAYNFVLENRKDTVLCNSIDSICRWFNKQPVQEHVGVWPWPSLTVNDFRSQTVLEFCKQHYSADMDLYANSTSNDIELMNCLKRNQQ